MNIDKKYGRNCKRWSKREVDYLKKHINKKTIEEIAEAVHRPPSGVEGKIRQIRRQKDESKNNNTWGNARNE